VPFYANVLGCRASLIYASENGYRVFDETNSEELTAYGIQNGVSELKHKMEIFLSPNVSQLYSLLFAKPHGH